MPSHFSTGTTRRRSPPWCKPGMYGNVPPFIDGRPSSLNAFATWRDLIGTDQFDLAGVMHLTRKTPFTGWKSSIPSAPYWLELEVNKTVDPEVYEIELYVKASWGTIDHHQWIHLQETDDPRWDTHLRYEVWVPDVRYAAIRVLA